MPEDVVVHDGGWTGINHPTRVRDAEGRLFVAKSNTGGAYVALTPQHDTHKANVREIVASHIMADELGLPTLTFQEGYVTDQGQRLERVLSPLQSDFHTLERADLSTVRCPDQAVELTVTDGFLGNWDATFNHSNVWLRSDGVVMGSDYGCSLAPGIEARGIPYANLKIMKQFATRENVLAVTDRLASWSDEKIHGMVERQGSKWITSWTPELEQELSGALIENRDALRRCNPFLKHVEGFQPQLHEPLLTARYELFYFSAAHAQLPPLHRVDLYLDILSAWSRHHVRPWVDSFLHLVRPAPRDSEVRPD